MQSILVLPTLQIDEKKLSAYFAWGVSFPVKRLLEET